MGEFLEAALRAAGLSVTWEGRGTERYASVIASEHETVRAGDIIVRIDPRYYRPLEVDDLRGDAAIARAVLGWRPLVTFEGLVREMMAAEMTRC